MTVTRLLIGAACFTAAAWALSIITGCQPLISCVYR